VHLLHVSFILPIGHHPSRAIVRSCCSVMLQNFSREEPLGQLSF
jgi:hypothetical protein